MPRPHERMGGRNHGAVASHYCVDCSMWLWPNRIARHRNSGHILITGEQAQRQSARMKLHRILTQSACTLLTPAVPDYAVIMASHEREA